MPPVFPIFVGSGRSGTTMVQAIFSAHPDLAITHESQFIPRLADRPYQREGGFAVDRFLADLQKAKDVQRLDIDDAALREALASSPPASYAEAVRTVFAVYAAQRGKDRYGDKSPGYVLHMDRLAELFPEARFVQVVRDGRDVALSYIETRFGPKTIAEGALYWKRRVSAGRAAGRRLGPGRYRELRYEDLVEDPETSVQQLCPFLELDFRPAMLRYFEQGERLQAETADPSAHGSLHLPPTRGLRDWRMQMAPPDVALFEALAGRTLTAFGYETGSAAASPPVYARAAAAWVDWQRQRAAARARSSRRGIQRRLSRR